MKYEIRHRYSGAVLFSLECESLKICTHAAIAASTSLSRANLYKADLSGADLSRANLSRANLYGADLSGADLYGANLSRANLYGADLSRADLYGADLSRADLSMADLSRANLSRANLYGADLSRANLYGANLSNISPLEIARRRITPKEGEFIGWKKLKGGIICKVIIPSDAQRVNAIYSRKCRASRVIVSAMYSSDGEIFEGVGIGLHDGETKYETGKETLPDSFDDRVTEECSNGIHFYITRAEAEAN